MNDPLANQPGSVQGDASYRIFNPMDLYETDVDPRLVRIVPRGKALKWLTPIKGRVQHRHARNHVYHYYQEGQHLNTAAKIAGVQASGQKMILTLDANDHYDIQGGTNNATYVVKGQLVVFQDGQTQGYVESTDKTTDGAHTVTVSKTDSSMDIAGQSVIGRTVVFYSNVQKEASKETDGRIPTFEKITHKMHVIREKFRVTDFETQNTAWFETGDGRKEIWYKGMTDTFERFEDQIDKATLLGPDSQSLTDADGNSLQTMFGVDPAIRKHGSTMEYYDRPDIQSFYEVMLQLDHAYGDESYFILEGHNLQIGRGQWLIEFAKAGTGNINFSPFDGGKEQALSMRFNSVKINDYDFYFNKLATLSNRDGLGAQGLPFRHHAYFIPCGHGKNPDQTPGYTGPAMQPYIVFTYSKPQGSERELYGYEDGGGQYKMWYTGAGAPTGATDDEASASIHMMKYCAVEMRCRNKFLLWEPESIAA